MIVLYCNRRTYLWIDPYYIADRLAPNESEWMIPGAWPVMDRYTVETTHNGNGWSYIVGPDGYREGPIRYRWEAQEWADEMNETRQSNEVKIAAARGLEK